MGKRRKKTEKYKERKNNNREKRKKIEGKTTWQKKSTLNFRYD